jgi:hypothetical protein
MSIKYGGTGFVELKKEHAHKHMLFGDMMWLREYSVMLYLWPRTHPCITRHQSGEYITRKPPRGTVKRIYYKLTYPRYPETLAKTTVYTDEEFLQYTLDIFSALDMLHAHNIVHRDVKAENVMCTTDKRGVLIDFTHSIRLRDEENTSLDDEVCTYSHRAPEVFAYKAGDRKGTYGKPSDVWSAGVLIFEMITNKEFSETMTPADEEDEMEAFLQDPNAVGQVQAKYFRYKQTMFWASEYWEWVADLINPDPSSRPTAHQMIDRIIAFATSKEIKLKYPEWRELKFETSRGTPEEGKLVGELLGIQKVLMERVEELFDLYDLKRSKGVLERACALIIRRGLVTKGNLGMMATALSIVLWTVIYDFMEDVSNVTKFVKDAELEWVKASPFETKHIYCKIILIVQHCEKDLFLYDYLDKWVEVNIGKQATKGARNPLVANNNNTLPVAERPVKKKKALPSKGSRGNQKCV